MIFLINKGHGGMVGGKYVTAPDKMYNHGNGQKAYEGVLNRVIGDKAIRNMYSLGLKYIDICSSNLDIPLKIRLDTINAYCKKYGKDNCLLIDMHSNAGGGTGFEIWTSPGETKSDEYAEKFFNMFERVFPDIKTRSGKSEDNDGNDKEALFMLITKSNCPAILPEFLFFDNFKDYLLLTNYTIQEKYAKMVAEFCYNIRND